MQSWLLLCGIATAQIPQELSAAQEVVRLFGE